MRLSHISKANIEFVLERDEVRISNSAKSQDWLHRIDGARSRAGFGLRKQPESATRESTRFLGFEARPEISPVPEAPSFRW